MSAKTLRHYELKSFLSLSGMLYTAVKSYKAAKHDEITVAIGAVVEVLQKSDNGWWLIRYLMHSTRG